jgi:hypothetical protein
MRQKRIFFLQMAENGARLFTLLIEKGDPLAFVKNSQGK